MSEQLIILSALILLPLIPAYLLFKLLPSSADVEGPMPTSNMKVRLGGAFGGYAALAMFLATFWSQTMHEKKDAMGTWRVQGRLQFADGAPRPHVSIDLGPPRLQIDNANNFYLEIPVAKGEEVPPIVIDAAGYPSRTVRLAPGDNDFGTNYKRIIDAKARQIRISDPIVFEKLPGQGAPVQVAGGG